MAIKLRQFLDLMVLLVAIQVFVFAEIGQAETLASGERLVRRVDIQIRDIFERPTNSVYSAANSLKINTREYIVRRELLFKEGDLYDEFKLKESERALRQIRYLRAVEIVPTIDGRFVDILVKVQDTWTFIPQFSVSSGTGRNRRSAGVSESDLLGLGKRFEVLYEEDAGRTGFETVYDDNRFWGTQNQLVAGFFSRTDGDRYVFQYGKPFRSLLDPTAYYSVFDVGDQIGRLFENGDERYIFRQKRNDLQVRFTGAGGSAETKFSRYTLGYQYQEDTFEEASLKDYQDLDLDPLRLSHDPALLADNRRFTGPVLGYERIDPDFISMNYIDRFSRVQDYNLGNQYQFSTFLAPKLLGSIDDAAILSGNHSSGYRINANSFLRGEVGGSSRLNQDLSPENSLLRAELKYYNVLGPLFISDLFLGRHTLASSFFTDYGNDLDRDRELLIGGDNAIRGYRGYTFTGDKRVAINLEDRMHFVDDAFQLLSFGGALFLEAGGATNDSLGRLVSDRMYSDAGFGLRIGFPRSSGERVLRIDVAFPLRDGPDGSGTFEPRFILSGGQLFDSKLRSENFGAENATLGVGFDR